MTPHEGVLREEYDDMLPVSLYKALKPPRYHLLDRHNDRIAVFDEARDDAECQRIVDAVNAHELKSRLADAQARVETLEAQRIKYGPICLNCGADKPCMTEEDANKHGASIPCTFDPAPRELWDRCKQLKQQHAALRERVKPIEDALRLMLQAFDPTWPGACAQDCFDTSDGHGYEMQEVAKSAAKEALATGAEGSI